jgi:hypothetical protein
VPSAVRLKPKSAASPVRTDVADAGMPSPESRPYYLVIDERFSVPIFVFLESDPRTNVRLADPGLFVRWVTLDLAAPRTDSAAARNSAGVRSDSAIGRDPERMERFREFPSERHLRAARFVLIEPRYIGPSWETYCGVFRPEGEGRTKHPSRRRPADAIVI